MEFKSVIKRGSIIVSLGLGLTIFTTAPGTTAFAAGTSASQQLVDSLKALNVDQVDYLYAYLQSVNLSDQEYNSILSNTNSVNAILKGQNPEDLPKAEKVEILNLFLDSVKLAHLEASIVDENGNAIDITNYKLEAGNNLFVQLKDLKGNLLATVNPKKEDLKPAVLQTKINALTSAVKAKKQLEKDGKFVPIPAGTLPNTATNSVDYMLLGGLLILIGGLAVVPAAKLVRKNEGLSEA